MALSGIREKDIEDFLYENPYLIHSSFKNTIPVRQEKKGKNRTDLTLRLDGQLTIIEIKKNPLTTKALEQILRYIELFQKTEPLAERHYLIGRGGKNREEFRQTAKEQKIDVLYLGADIPPSFIFDTKKRIYIPYQEGNLRKPWFVSPVFFSY